MPDYVNWVLLRLKTRKIHLANYGDVEYIDVDNDDFNDVQDDNSGDDNDNDFDKNMDDDDDDEKDVDDDDENEESHCGRRLSNM